MTRAPNRPGGLDVLYLINGLGPGGAERSLAELVPFYLAAGIRPTVVCLKRRHEGVEEEVQRTGCEVRFLAPGGMPSRIRQLRALLATGRFNLLHTTIYEADIAGRVAAMGSGVPVLTSLVNTAYDPVRLRDPNVRRAKFLATREIDGLTARWLTTHFHAITEAVRDSAVESLRIRPERVTVIPRGRDPARLGDPGPERRRRAREMLGLDAAAPVLVNVGRQEFQKGQVHLLDAMPMLVEKHPDVQLLIVGREGHATPELQSKLARLRLGKSVRFLGFRADIPEILAASDVFVFPSLYEGLGGSVIEAMALGLPVVASDLPALREVVDHERTGYLVPASDPAALSATLVDLLDDPDRVRALGRTGRERFEESFTIERSAARMIELYRSLVRAA